MSCYGCDNSGYRSLCAYDPYHDKCPHPLGGMSFKCQNGKCHHQDKAPSKEDNSFSNLMTCQQHCGDSPVLGQKSFNCEGGKCVLQHRAAGPGYYSNIQDCQKHCGDSPSGPPYHNI